MDDGPRQPRQRQWLGRRLGHLGTGHTDAQGGLATDVSIPDDLGGWHMLKLVQDQAV